MLKAEGKIFNKGPNAGDVLYISKDITDDSAYPFKHGDEVQLELDPKQGCLIIHKKKVS